MSRHSRLPRTAVALLLAAVALGGCNRGASIELADAGPPTDGGPDGAVDGGGEHGEPVTWFDDIEPLVRAHCLGCHGPDDIGGVDLTLADAWEAADGPDGEESGAPWWRAAIVESVVSGSMPPWLPDPDCRPIDGQRVLDEAVVDLFQAWADRGYTRGRTPPPRVGDDPRADDGDPDVILDPGQGYVPGFDRNDDVRCLPLGDATAEPTYIAGIGFEPAVPVMVRHARVYAAHPLYADMIDALDAAAPGPGYPCYGGIDVPGRQLLMAWTPDTDPLQLPAESAMVVPAGSRFVLQVQYDARGLVPDEAVPTDRSAVSMWTVPDAPANQVEIVEFTRTTLSIAAGEADVESRQDFVFGGEATIIGAVPVMQRLGRSLESTVTRTEDDDDACVVRIDDWQPSWAATWLFPPADWVSVQRGDVHRLRCIHDNAPGSPGLAGQSPVDVTWGEGFTDEQCATALILSRPFDAVVGAAQCGGFDPCVESCRDAEADPDCFARCHAVGEQSCPSCLLRATGACARSQCEPELQGLGECSVDCVDGELGCIIERCTDAFTALAGCVDADLTTAACGEQYAACGVRFGR